MLIDKEYIEQRLLFWMDKKQQSIHRVAKKKSKLRRLVARCLPRKWKSLILRALLYLHYVKGIKKQIRYNSRLTLHPITVDFFRYVYTKHPSLQLSDFYPPSDVENAISMIDKRLKSIIGDYDHEITEKIRDQLESEKKLRTNIKKRGGFYCLREGGTILYLSENDFSVPVCIGKYGLRELPNHVVEKIRETTVLDIGALRGDTSLMFLEFSPSKILAFEPVKQHYELLKKTIQKNRLEGLVIPVKEALGDKKMKQKISVQGHESSLNDNISNPLGEEEWITVETIDNKYSEENIGLIKIDVEGFEYFVLSGGKKTIQQQKPILIVSMYHTGKDFFEIPPMLRQFVPNYQYRFLDICPQDSIAEKILIAYLN